MANSGGNRKEVYDVEMLNDDRLKARQYLNTQQEVNASLKAEKGQLVNESVDLFKKTNKPRDKRIS